MKISLDWIREYVKVELSLLELTDRMSMIGLVVESVEDRDGDYVLDVETYANRPDTLGHLGVAREIAAMLGLPLVVKNWPLVELPQETSECTDIQIWDSELCPRYCGILVRDLTVGPSPDWLRKRIEALGLKPINNVVDVTNYVLFSTAQPIHAFDFAKMTGSKVIVRRAGRGETLKDFEGLKHQLSPEMLVIADENRPIALAGIIGGEESGVTGETRDVFIESAHFDPVSIRLTARKLGISTDASYRFERNTDISYPPEAAMMAASLITRMGGKATRGILDIYPEPRKNRSLLLRHYRVSDLLGVEIPEAFVETVLSALGFKMGRQNKGIWRVEVPSFRVDIDREADLIEEVARFYGYDNIPSEVTPIHSFSLGKDRDKQHTLDVRDVLLGQGFDEVINWSFADPEKEGIIESGRPAIVIRNPISARASLLRTHLLTGLLENAARNLNRGMEGVHLFEIGKIYFYEDEKHQEKLTLGILSAGLLPGAAWMEIPKRADFFGLKGALEAVMTGLRYVPFSFEATEHAIFAEGRALSLLYRGQPVGTFGVLKSAIAENHSLDEAVYFAELDLACLFDKQPRPLQYVPVPKYPGVSRDLSILVDRDIPYQEVKRILERTPLSMLEDFELIDRFVGPSIPPDKVSLSIRFRYRNPTRTLLTEEVDRLEEEIISRLKSIMNIHLREGKIDN